MIYDETLPGGSVHNAAARRRFARPTAPPPRPPRRRRRLSARAADAITYGTAGILAASGFTVCGLIIASLLGAFRA
ncbi:hypothetical protein [Microbacterium sp. VKM Ac-2923]|uniref:hypothetical protein n=1 Tax=Microbacterium sp. VKM Ac-2923 TaxID=2929476 RepID=UPI001FB27484|nr:hypothetical protein [Microbacterium sp. VKM Ac-2923]MCJ1709219.1 hypothetical protein [Microbacterium sp. VKM Ac-2923]